MIVLTIYLPVLLVSVLFFPRIEFYRIFSGFFVFFSLTFLTVFFPYCLFPYCFFPYVFFPYCFFRIVFPPYCVFLFFFPRIVFFQERDRLSSRDYYSKYQGVIDEVATAVDCVQHALIKTQLGCVVNREAVRGEVSARACVRIHTHTHKHVNTHTRTHIHARARAPTHTHRGAAVWWNSTAKRAPLKKCVRLYVCLSLSV